MRIEPLGVTIRDLYKGYKDDGDNGVVAYSGCLDVRPPFQREFIYDDVKQKRVIYSIIKEYPLGVFYWGTTDISGYYVLSEGQQRTLSICKFIHGDFSIEYNGSDYTFNNLPQSVRDTILNYNLIVFKCDGTDSEKLDWFETINISSEPLTPQELRNAVYTGTWLSDAKRYFSKTNCPAVSLAGDYIKGTPNRQEILELALKWVANRDNLKIEGYMDAHKNDKDASDLWNYFRDVIDWVKTTFGMSTLDLKGVQWGILYNKYSEKRYVDNRGNITCFIDSIEGQHTREELAAEILRLNDDDEITSRVGIFEYVLSGDERKLSVRKFPDKVKIKKFHQQGGCCALCKKPFEISQLAADHITPWSKGGKTVEGNCQLLCVSCNSRKSNKKETATDECSCINCSKPVKRGMFCSFCGTKN